MARRTAAGVGVGFRPVDPGGRRSAAHFARRGPTDRDACDAHGALLIFDEIPTGLGKTGKLFSCEHDGVIPDILVVGKSLGGGILPIAGLVCRPELELAQNYALGHYTHEKNPVTTRAALTTIQIIEEEGLVEIKMNSLKSETNNSARSTSSTAPHSTG